MYFNPAMQKKCGKHDNEGNSPTIKPKQTNKQTHTKKYRLGGVVKKSLISVLGRRFPGQPCLKTKPTQQTKQLKGEKG